MNKIGKWKIRGHIHCVNRNTRRRIQIRILDIFCIRHRKKDLFKQIIEIFRNSFSIFFCSAHYIFQYVCNVNVISARNNSHLIVGKTHRDRLIQMYL